MDANRPVVEPARPVDRRAVEDLLTLCGLPLDGVAECFERFLVVRGDGSRIDACAGIELHGSDCLFRSLAVRPEARGEGVGRAIFAAALDLARRSGCSDVYLLTRTIERMASRMGFEPIARERVPQAIRASREFAINACATATVMRRTL